MFLICNDFSGCSNMSVHIIRYFNSYRFCSLSIDGCTCRLGTILLNWYFLLAWYHPCQSILTVYIPSKCISVGGIYLDAALVFFHNDTDHLAIQFLILDKNYFPYLGSSSSIYSETGCKTIECIVDCSWNINKILILIQSQKILNSILLCIHVCYTR